MKVSVFILSIILAMGNSFTQGGFKKQQMQFERVKVAYQDKWSGLQSELKIKGFNPGFKMCVRAFKSEGILELWLQNTDGDKYKLFKSYHFCQHSGLPGPKLKEGDRQTPEGFYHIAAFNPQSNFYLSLGINYPNLVDYARSEVNNVKPGSDIYIHGNCVTVGCIPLTDELIKEVYVMAIEARDAGQVEIPVSIFPCKMTEKNLAAHLKYYPGHQVFWAQLQEGYTYFERHKKLPNVIEDKNRGYSFK